MSTATDVDVDIRHDHNVPIREIAERVRSLGQELAEHEVGVRVLPGGELAQSEADLTFEPR